MTGPVGVPTVGAMSRRQATAEQLVWRALVGLLLVVVLWILLMTSIDVL